MKALGGGPRRWAASPTSLRLPGFQHGWARRLASEGRLAYEMSRKAPRAETPATEGLFWGNLKSPLQILSLPPWAQPQAHRQLPNWGPTERQRPAGPGTLLPGAPRTRATLSCGTQTCLGLRKEPKVKIRSLALHLDTTGKGGHFRHLEPRCPSRSNHRRRRALATQGLQSLSSQNGPQGHHRAQLHHKHRVPQASGRWPRCSCVFLSRCESDCCRKGPRGHEREGGVRVTRSRAHGLPSPLRLKLSGA